MGANSRPAAESSPKVRRIARSAARTSLMPPVVRGRVSCAGQRQVTPGKAKRSYGAESGSAGATGHQPYCTSGLKRARADRGVVCPDQWSPELGRPALLCPGPPAPLPPAPRAGRGQGEEHLVGWGLSRPPGLPRPAAATTGRHLWRNTRPSGMDVSRNSGSLQHRLSRTWWDVSIDRRQTMVGPSLRLGRGKRGQRNEDQELNLSEYVSEADGSKPTVSNYQRATSTHKSDKFAVFKES